MPDVGRNGILYIGKHIQEQLTVVSHYNSAEVS